jgi:hypothetical protein
MVVFAFLNVVDESLGSSVAFKHVLKIPHKILQRELSITFVTFITHFQESLPEKWVKNGK